MINQSVTKCSEGLTNYAAALAATTRFPPPALASQEAVVAAAITELRTRSGQVAVAGHLTSP